MSARVQTIEWLNARIDELEGENKHLRQTLEWYADEDNYDDEYGAPGRHVETVTLDGTEYDFDYDVGERARKALASIQPK